MGAQSTRPSPAPPGAKTNSANRAPDNPTPKPTLPTADEVRRKAAAVMHTEQTEMNFIADLSSAILQFDGLKRILEEKQPPAINQLEYVKYAIDRVQERLAFWALLCEDGGIEFDFDPLKG